MYIHEMSEIECREALEKSGFGRLGCARDNRPYIVPIYFIYDDNCLYGFSTLGKKIEWMRENPEVCVETDELVSHDHWMSVIVFGRYEELYEVPENSLIRSRALELLQRRAMFWEPAAVNIDHDVPESVTPVCFRIQIEEVTGRRASADPETA